MNYSVAWFSDHESVDDRIEVMISSCTFHSIPLEQISNNLSSFQRRHLLGQDECGLPAGEGAALVPGGQPGQVLSRGGLQQSCQEQGDTK